MFVPTTFAAALLMTILSTICWGSFANTAKISARLVMLFEPGTVISARTALSSATISISSGMGTWEV